MTHDLVLYANPKKPWHSENVRWFREIIHEFPEIDFYNPNLVAPWHVKAMINGIDMNFWPCAGKANMEREKTVYGYAAVSNLIKSAMNYVKEEFEVIDTNDI